MVSTIIFKVETVLKNLDGNKLDPLQVLEILTPDQVVNNKMTLLYCNLLLI